MRRLHEFWRDVWHWVASAVCWYSVVVSLDGVRVHACHHERLDLAKMCRDHYASYRDDQEVELNPIPRFWTIAAVCVGVTVWLSWPGV